MAEEGKDVFTTFGGLKYLWGNVPALDIGQIELNEGTPYEKDFFMLFAASGDLRNVIKSIVGLPQGFQKRCEVFINDKDTDIVARNALILLGALQLDPNEAAETMVHLWYSALIPQLILDRLVKEILPLIDEVCSKTREKASDALLSKIWVFGSRRLRLVLRRDQWVKLPSYLRVPAGLNAMKAQEIRTSVTLSPARKDYWDRALCTQLPAWRLARLSFREEGILLPFGASRRDFKTPNPTFFQEQGIWPMKDSSDPIDGWSLHDVLAWARPANNDIYGGLYFYLQHLFHQFCERLLTSDVSFNLSQMNALELPTFLKGARKEKILFDRIEVSNIVDRGYLGLAATLSTLGPLLWHKDQNLFATLVTLFLNATSEVYHENNANSADVQLQVKRLCRFLQPSKNMVFGSRHSMDSVKYMSALDLFQDFDELFARYMKQCDFPRISEVTGLTMKSKSTIVEPWPMRLRETATDKDFNILCASDRSGCERYVEWKRT